MSNKHGGALRNAPFVVLWIVLVPPWGGGMAICPNPPCTVVAKRTQGLWVSVRFGHSVRTRCDVWQIATKIAMRKAIADFFAITALCVVIPVNRSLTYYLTSQMAHAPKAQLSSQMPRLRGEHAPAPENKDACQPQASRPLQLYQE